MLMCANCEQAVLNRVPLAGPWWQMAHACSQVRTYGYNGQGDVTGITDNSTFSRTLSYDAQGRLKQVTLGTTAAMTETVALTYNAQGQRASYTVTPAGAGQPSLVERFQYRGGALAQVGYSGTAVPTAYTDTYLYRQDGTPLELLRQQGGTTSRYWYLLDGRQNVVALTGSGGNVVDRYSYDLWGRPISISETVPQQLRYAGYWYDNETQWYWLSVRSYDPALERFLQPDPSEIEGVQSYAYAGNDPVDAIDPSGLETCIFNLHSTDANSAKGTDCEDDPAGVTEDTTAPENNIAISGVEGVTLRGGGGRVGFGYIAGVGLTTFGACSFPGVCGVADFLKQAISAGGYIVFQGLKLLCNATGVCQDLDTILHDSNVFHKLAAFGDLALWIPGFDVANGAELLAKAGIDFAHFALVVKGASCTLCFPAGTQVATPHGEQSIQTLKIGNQVLSEDPQTRTVEPERILAVIHHPASPLIGIDLTDGTTIAVTVDHPFWVDRSHMISAPGWVDAGHLHFGDQLRTESGSPASVVGLRYNLGTADVYTLTVARDHTFFVGHSRVLVHNAVGCSSRVLGRALEGLFGFRPLETAAHHIVPDGDPRAATARAILSGFGITDLNIAANGVFLPRFLKSLNPSGAAVHSVIHTDTYYTAITKLLQDTKTKAEAIKVIQDIGTKLLNNTFPY